MDGIWMESSSCQELLHGFGSDADMVAQLCEACFAPMNGHSQPDRVCLKSANSGSQQSFKDIYSSLQATSATPEVQPVKLSPNIGRPLFDSARAASSWRTSQCSANTPSAMRTMSAAIQFLGSPMPENRPWMMTKSPSAMIRPGSYLRDAGEALMRLKRPARRGPMWALCCVYLSDQDRYGAS